jgi:uncharacterized RDD family membrane protein YckC
MNRETSQLVTLRVLAFAIDALGMLFLLILPATIASYAIVFTLDSTPAVAKVWQVVLALFLAGMLLRDSIGGRSPGKKLLGLAILTPAGKTCGPLRSIARNLPLMIPGWNLVELLVLLLSRESRRPGDLIARTRVEQE